MSEKDPRWSPGEVVSLLRSVEWFDGLPEDDLVRIAGIAREISCGADDVLFREGERGDAFYVVGEGSVEISTRPPGGGRESLAVRRRGEAFGEMALLEDEPRSATATVLEPTRLLRLDRSAFAELLGGDVLALRLLRDLSRSLRGAGVRFASTETLRDPGSRDREAAVAVSRRMQASLLPPSAPQAEGFDLAAGTTTEQSGRGGSVWDWIRLSDGRVVLLTLDVRQEGFPPAHHLGVVRAVLRAVATATASVRELLARSNDAVAGAAVAGLEQFVDVGALAVGPDGLEWGSAGRVPGGIIRRDGSFESFGAHGPPLGMMEGFRYNGEGHGMGSGDTVFVLSHASRGLFLGAADLVAQLHGKPAGDVVSTLHRAIRKAQGDRRAETSVLYARKH